MNSFNNNNIPGQGKVQAPPSKPYPQEARLLLDTLFGEFTSCYIEFRLLKIGIPAPIQLFYPSVATIQWDLVKKENSGGYNCYFGVCLRKTNRGDKASVASIPALWGDVDGKNFPGGKPEALAQLQKLPPYLYPSIIVDTGHGIHPYWLLKEAEPIESPQDILRLEAYMKGLALTLGGDATSDLGRVLRLPGLLNQKDPKNPCLARIIHWEPERRFTPMDFDDYQAEIRESPKRAEGAKRERSDEFNTLSIEKLLDNCAFIRHCQDDAATLSEPHWWSMVHVLGVFGEPGRKKIHELSEPYPRYSVEETEQKIYEALRAADKEIGPHTCVFIQQDLGFVCPVDCQAKSLGVKSPAGLAARLATTEKLKGNYITETKDGKLKLNLAQLTIDLLAEFHFATMKDTDEVLVYRDGVWRYGGEAFIKAECQRRVGVKEVLTEHKVNEIIGHIQRTTYCDRRVFNQNKWVITLENGLLDVRNKELKPHTPEFLSTIRIPVTYDPEAECPRIRRFLAEVLEPQDIPAIEEVFGYSLIPDYSIQRTFLFIGDGSNGKSTLLNLLGIFIGKDNCASVPWHALEYSRFASARLDGKLVNIYADLPSRSMDSTGVFKMLTGGDAINAEKKFKDGYSFVNFARLVFSANKPPKILDEDSYAFWRRWIIINLPNQFSENDPKTDPRILDKLTTEAELSGLLNLALDGLERLLTNSKFSYGKTVDQTQSYYLRASDPVFAFVEDCCELDPDAVISKDALFEAYKDYCKANKTPLINRDSFHKALKNSPHFKVVLTRPLVDGDRVQSWKGIKVVNPVNPVNLLDPFKRRNTPVEYRGGGVGEEVNKRKGKKADQSDQVDQKSSDDIPHYPTAPCPTCGSINFWLTPDNRWLCERCHPKPK